MNKVQKCVLVADVGGTNIKYGIVGSDLSLVEAIGSTPSQQSKSTTEIISTLSAIITELTGLAQKSNLSVVACVFAFPGPFDYRQGISHMHHKFESLYGHNLRQSLGKNRDFPILFLNDADAFGYGVRYKCYPKAPSKILAITLGTGIGSSFFNGYKLINIEIWDRVFRNGILEDCIAAKALQQNYKKLTGKTETVKMVAELARRGDRKALVVLEQYGKDLGEGLAHTAGDLQPDIIVLGGGIANESDLFSPVAETTYQSVIHQKIGFDTVKAPDISLFGAAAFAFREQKARK